MASRSDGPWELLATAVGVSESIATTLAGLGADAIDNATSSVAISPGVIEARVQAIAAHQPRALERITAKWKPILELQRDDLMTPASDFWTAAWAASLRFLVKLPPISTVELERLPQPISDELMVMKGRDRAVDLPYALAQACKPSVEYGILRQLGMGLATQDQINRENLVALVGGGESPQELERLRVVSDAGLSFSADGVEYLAELFRQRWFVLPMSSSSGGDLLLTQIVASHVDDHGLYSKATDQLAERLERDGPLEWARSAYLLAETEWRCP